MNARVTVAVMPLKKTPRPSSFQLVLAQSIQPVKQIALAANATVAALPQTTMLPELLHAKQCIWHGARAQQQIKQYHNDNQSSKSFTFVL